MNNQENTGYSRHRAFKAMCEAKKKAREEGAEKKQLSFDDFMSEELLKYEGNDVIGQFKHELLKKPIGKFDDYVNGILHFMASSVGIVESLNSIDVKEFAQHVRDENNSEAFAEAKTILGDIVSYFTLTYFNEQVDLMSFIDRLEFIWWCVHK